MNEYLYRLRLALFILMHGDKALKDLIVDLNVSGDKLERAIEHEELGEEKSNAPTNPD